MRIIPFMCVMVCLSWCGVGRADYAAGMEAYRKAWAAYAAQDYAGAKRWAMQAVAVDPTNPHAEALVGDLAYLAHDLVGAQRAWSRALALEPRLRALKLCVDQLTLEAQVEAQPVALDDAPFVIRAPSTGRLPSTETGPRPASQRPRRRVPPGINEGGSSSSCYSSSRGRWGFR